MSTNSSPTQAGRLTLNFKGNDAQQAFVEDKNDETAYIGGVGSGKTVGGLMRLSRHIFEWNPGETIAVVSPTVPMMRNVIVPEMQKWGLIDRDGVEYRRSENTIEYPNETRVILESANNDRKIERLRGLNLAAAWLDEPAEHQHRTYKILGDRLRTGEYRNLFVTGTPKGYNWVYDEFADIDPTHTDSVGQGTLIRNEFTTTIYGIPTEANRTLPEDYIESRKRQHTGASYEQEILGSFTQFEGLVYPWFSEEHIIDSDDVPEPGVGEYGEVIYGVDWGHNNPATILAVVKQPMEMDDEPDRWVVVDEWYQRRQTVNDHSRALEEMQNHWGPGPIYCDPSEPSSIETLNRDGLAAQKAKNDVTPGIQHVSSLRNRLRVAESCQNLRNEFSQYRYKDKDDSDRPVKQNDHLLDSLRYALFTHKNKTKRETRRRSGGSSSRRRVTHR